MAEMPGMIRPDLQALPQVRDRMTFLYLELAQACGQMLDGTFPRTRGGDPKSIDDLTDKVNLFPACAGVIPTPQPIRAAPTLFPRTRGGDPQGWYDTIEDGAFSPHTRG